ncbi:unnamed protein product [Acanthoscelides obtectus]|uniref:Uncharacterized protein n=1 Tax=Acanthoscelides obtectus TaxID=200917 RepID=A0A9P0LRC5_ACAOB|nr:unnamed protein product [Acanthoscelides obtectus]CAH2009368.1 unnamed protein product [Acanthoscelides obtectus]CAK1682312.1 hypothetical protein AOBTE_LOCUS33557 [Acanthoscelides obtectus]CAK1682320.1 hypothetical protein AOBTE_LOCUS33565 [Acanthoscelides obtectus]
MVYYRSPIQLLQSEPRHVQKRVPAIVLIVHAQFWGTRGVLNILHFRLYRQNYARKFSRDFCNLDIINRLLLCSDPLITGTRRTPRKITKPFLKETVEMFLPEEPMGQSYLSGDNDNDDDEGSAQEIGDCLDDFWLSSS